MSQLTSAAAEYIIPPGTVATLTGNINVGGGGPTPVPPDGAGNINVVGDTTSIIVEDNVGTNSLIISAANTLTGTTTTVGNVGGTVLTIPLGAVPGVYEIEIRIAAYNASTPAGAGWKVFAVARTDGTNSTVIGFNDSVHESEVALMDALVACTADLANNVIVGVGGVAGLTIDWAAQASWTEAT
jgi:hypothetical protein